MIVFDETKKGEWCSPVNFMADCTATDILKELPNLIFAVTALIAVLKGSDAIRQGNEIKVETNRLKQQELNLLREK